MNASEIRQSFFDFFKSKQHTWVPSASLMPTSPNLLFTNAGMNPFVPHFLGEIQAPHPRIVDTQKCIRAGGKHNDLEDVGFDTYHHTFFEMLGNWSFGDYFKKEAIEWAWELLARVWHFPRERLYVTVYKPGVGEPAEFDQEAYDIWKALLEKEGLDPQVHICMGGKKDNFWMMGDTGPCGPCSEIHIDLTPKGDTLGTLVNQDSPYCIEIWNLVFIQFNAEENGSFVPLSAKHVDTGMGFERVAGIMATTRNFTDYSTPPSNYNSDLFTDLFRHIAEKSGHTYGATIPEDRNQMTEAEMNDCIFRVLADHIRTLSFSIADGILPGNEGRNYVLRRILRRAVLFGKRLNLGEGFFTSLVEPLIEKMGVAFPELLKHKSIIQKVIANEEKTFERTLDRGLQLFDKICESGQSIIPGEAIFKLYDTFGFPVDLTAILAKERSRGLDMDGFEKAMQEQRVRARNAQQKSIIKVVDNTEHKKTETIFVGYDHQNLSDFKAVIQNVIPGPKENQYYLIVDKSPFYGEKGGQVGDSGIINTEGESIRVENTIFDESGQLLHEVHTPSANNLLGQTVELNVDVDRRLDIERNHTATHMLHWALRFVLGSHVHQAGSYVNEDHLRFDFTHFEAPSPKELEQIELMVNAKLLSNMPVRWYEVPFAEKPKECLAFFGEKYGSIVRVVDIAGYSVELCGGTHVQATGEIGLIKILSESAISAGTRRLEATSGYNAFEYIVKHYNQLHRIASKFSCTPTELDDKLSHLYEQRSHLEKQLRTFQQKEAAALGHKLADKAHNQEGLNWVVSPVPVESPNELREVGVSVLNKIKPGVVVLGASFQDKVNILALCSDEAIQRGYKAGDIVRTLCAQLGGKGGGNPGLAMGGGKDVDKLTDILKAYAPQSVLA